MNITPMEKQIQILNALVEGCSIRSTERMTGVHRDTIMRLLVKAGDQCQRAMEEYIQGFHSKRLQVDEIWTYVGKKQKQVKPHERHRNDIGDVYVFVALDADSKLIPSYTIGKRNRITATKFMLELKEKLNGNGRVQLTTDGYKAFLSAVERAFGADIDYAQLVKVFGPMSTVGYVPPKLVETTPNVIAGRPDKKHISTSYVERQNLTIRMAMRRFTRLTNAFSKKLENLKAAIALHFAHYNFMRVHQTLKVTPAMEAGITDHIWGWRELLST